MTIAQPLRRHIDDDEIVSSSSFLLLLLFRSLYPFVRDIGKREVLPRRIELYDRLLDVNIRVELFAFRDCLALERRSKCTHVAEFHYVAILPRFRGQS